MLRHTYLRLLSSLALASLLLIGGTSQDTAAPACFPETGFCIDGRFRDYWEQNGGLPVFGFPIGPAQAEVNRETGQSYLTQWFERNRFELHPENAPPYDVLLGRLGDDLLRRQGIDWQTQPRESGPLAGCLWFEQTGHNVCDQAGGLGFKSYWQTHGLRDPHLDAYGRSLALFGLPLTDFHMEVNPADGQLYLTQWFERARLEWHPEKPDAYKVLLGLLGDEAHASGATKVAENVIGRPVSRAGFVFWQELHDGTASLYALHVATGFRYTTANQVEPSSTVAVDDAQIAWIERSPDGQQQYVRLDAVPSPGNSAQIILRSGGNVSSFIRSIALAADTLYYDDATSGHVGLYARNIQTGAETLVDKNGRDPVAGDGILLWSRYPDNDQSDPGRRAPWELHLRKLASGEERVIATAAGFPMGGFGEYAVSSDDVVYAFSAPGADNRVYRYRISTGEPAPISLDAASSPSIGGGVVAWATNPYFDRDPSSNWAVQIYGLRSGAIATIAQGPALQSTRYVTLVGDRVAYTVGSGKGAGQGLYLATLLESVSV